jgi:hypothetical protein
MSIIVALDVIPDGLRPGMSVQLRLARCPDMTD